jgi:hypothetical protein
MVITAKTAMEWALLSRNIRYAVHLINWRNQMAAGLVITASPHGIELNWEVLLDKSADLISHMARLPQRGDHRVAVQ